MSDMTWLIGMVLLGVLAMAVILGLTVKDWLEDRKAEQDYWRWRDDR
jgi:hypothetical protein